MPTAQIGQGFAQRLASAHDSGCPWRTAACDPSLAAFPPLERQVIARGFRERAAALARLDVLPPVAESAYAAINPTRRCSSSHPPPATPVVWFSETRVTISKDRSLSVSQAFCPLD